MEDVIGKLIEAGYEVKQGKTISVRAPGMQRFMRLDSLGTGYRDTERFTGDAPPFSMIVDIRRVLDEQKGPAYERWARTFNNNQISEVLCFLGEHRIDSFDKLDTLADAATERFNDLCSDQEVRKAAL